MFVERNQKGDIIGVFANLQKGYAEEQLADNHISIRNFLNPPPTVADRIAAIEKANPITQQHLRELILAVGQGTAAYARALAAEQLVQAERNRP